MRSTTANIRNAKNVFISHSTRDTWIARHIAADIERKGRRFGVTTFLDAKDIGPGELINESLRQSLRACAKFVVVLSSESIQREWVLIEIGAAWGLRKPIVVILDKVVASKIPKAIASHRAIDLNDLENHLARITKIEDRKKRL